jgi:lipopolysaccharide/colanic/teichoic acid biosynthesis glycosyltransferase
MAVQITPIQTLKSKPGYLRAKRVLDIVLTVLLFLPIGITMIVVALLIKLNSKGPVFFPQKRIGKNGAEFTMFKFRSMYVSSDDSIHRRAIEQYINGEKINHDGEDELPFKLGNDPRVTPIGRFLRRTSLDELPQFINVLRGEMTLVGPRPPLPYEVALYSSHDLLRLSGKPGITGPWQIYGRSQVTFQEMVEMDIAYLQQQSIWYDLKLIILTPYVMISGRGGV